MFKLAKLWRALFAPSIFGVDDAIIGAGIMAAGSAYSAHQMSSAQADAAQALNTSSIDMFESSKTYNREEAEKARLFNAEQALLQREAATRERWGAQDFNQAMMYEQARLGQEETQRNRDYQERMSNTSYQRAVGDMTAAGLNPMLAYSQGGASTPSGSAASVSSASSSGASQSSASGSGASAPGAPKLNPVTRNAVGSTISGAIDGAMKIAQLDRMDAETKNIEANTVGKEYQNRVDVQLIESRIRNYKTETEGKALTFRQNLDLEEIRNKAERAQREFDMRRLSKDGYEEQMQKLNQQLTELGVPKAKAESDFYKETGSLGKYIGLVLDLLGMGNSAAGLAGKAKMLGR